MIIGINKEFKIMAINSEDMLNLTVIELDETLHKFPFRGWSNIRIKAHCYKVTNISISVYPHMDINFINMIEGLTEEEVKLESDRLLTLEMEKITV